MSSPTIGATERALYSDRSVIRQHAMRRTLWTMTPQVASLAHASSTLSLVGPQNRHLAGLVEANGVAQNGAEWICAAKAQLAETIHQEGPITTRQLGDTHPHLAVPLAYGTGHVSAHSRVALLLGFDGEVLRTRPSGSWTNSQYAWSSVRDWSPGAFDARDEDAASVELLDRYLRAFGPVTETDMQWWTGWTKTKVRRALRRLAPREVAIGDTTGWLSPSDHDGASEEEPWVALLPGLDPTTMGWKQRDWYVEPSMVPLLFDRNGNAGPTVWVDGRVVGGWIQHPSGEIRYKLLDATAENRRADLDAAAKVLARVYAETRHKVRFPSPILRELS